MLKFHTVTVRIFAILYHSRSCSDKRKLLPKIPTYYCNVVSVWDILRCKSLNSAISPFFNFLQSDWNLDLGREFRRFLGKLDFMSILLLSTGMYNLTVKLEVVLWRTHDSSDDLWNSMISIIFCARWGWWIKIQNSAFCNFMEYFCNRDGD